jgi:hypothetical protein
MAALTKARNTLRMGVGEVILGSLDAPLKAGVTVFQGGMVALELSSGFYVPASATLGLVVAGRFDGEKAASPSLVGGAANGTVVARVEQGIFRFNNSSAGDAIAVTERGKVCYVVDDNTVAKTDSGGTRPLAGLVIDIDSSGVFVQCSLQMSAREVVAGTPEQIAANAALSTAKRTSILAVSGAKTYTLAAALFQGQRKTIFCKSVASTPNGVVTVTGGNGFTTLTFGASSANSGVELEGGSNGWDIVGVSGTVAIA